ncbi:MAG TPA: hypothetical protein VGM50_00300 [Gemmatimonadaceae bacterium]
MDLYISSLLLGAVGLGVMALGGLGLHGGHAGHGHAGHAHTGGHAASHASGAGRAFWLLTSPRLLFSFLLGFGTVGEVLSPYVGGVLLLAGAVLGGVLFERLIVTPLWNFAMRFASTPAVTLESAVTDEATAVTSFDLNGHGIVSIEVDGQIIQVLATLQPADRDLGVRVRAGQRLRIEDVNATSNQCTVSVL